MARDPFVELGLSADATEAQIRDARRRLAKEHHPDAGGDDARMRVVNAAATDALRARSVALVRSQPEAQPPPQHAGQDAAPVAGEVFHTARDVPSFTVEALPVDTFEALVLVAAEIADVVDDEPPYRLDVILHVPLRCWCRLEVVPDAGASTVSLSVGAVDDQPRPPTAVVRDLWIAALNDLDWPEQP